jgi:hypothetical protein
MGADGRDPLADPRGQDAGRPPALLASIFVDRHRALLYALRSRISRTFYLDTAIQTAGALDCAGRVGILVSVEMKVAVYHFIGIAGIRDMARVSR